MQLVANLFASNSIRILLLLTTVWGAAQFSLQDGKFDKRDVAGQTYDVLICRASMGIGEQLVYEYTDAGANLVIVARGKGRLGVSWWYQFNKPTTPALRPQVW